MGAVELPCARKATYCTKCWDHALAQSLNSTGEASCPTCRGHVHVDFDPDKLCLVFSRAQTPPAEVADESAVDGSRQTKNVKRQDVIKRLRWQALPAQVKLLRAHGKRNPALREMALTPEAQFHMMSVSDLKQHIVSLGHSSADCLEKSDLV